MRTIVLDTNCLIAILPSKSPFHNVWNELLTDDNKFVDCAICGEAELIVTNDKHFSILNAIDFPKVIIQRIEDFSRSL